MSSNTDDLSDADSGLDTQEALQILGNPSIGKILDGQSLTAARKVALHFARLGVEIYYLEHPDPTPMARSALEAGERLANNPDCVADMEITVEFLRLHGDLAYSDDDPQYDMENEGLCFLCSALLSFHTAHVSSGKARLVASLPADYFARQYINHTVQDYLSFKHKRAADDLYRQMYDEIAAEVLDVLGL